MSGPLAPAATAPPAPSELASLTRRLVDGEEAAYRMFFELYLDRLTRYLLVVTAGDEHAAREAVQGAFTRVVRHIRVFDDEAVFWSWLTVLARTAHADARRKRRRYLSFIDRFTRHTAVVANVGESPPAEGRLDESLARHVADLPADERELITQKYTARRAVRDLAAELGTTEKAVESRLARIRQKLKTALLADLKQHEPPA